MVLGSGTNTSGVGVSHCTSHCVKTVQDGFNRRSGLPLDLGIRLGPANSPNLLMSHVASASAPILRANNIFGPSTNSEGGTPACCVMFHSGSRSIIFVLSEGALCEFLMYDFWVFMPVVDIHPHLCAIVSASTARYETSECIGN